MEIIVHSTTRFHYFFIISRNELCCSFGGLKKNAGVLARVTRAQ